MTIRTRLTLWYSGILFLSMLFIAGIAYKHFLDERSERGKTTLREFFSGAVEDPDDLLAVTLWLGLPAALIGLGGGWFLMRKALAPVNSLTQAVEKMNERNLGEKIPRTNNGDELDRLTEVFNGMTQRLSDSFQQIREFTLHASHELKTPLTVMRGEIEIALREENCPAPQRERLLSQLDEIERLTKIVDGLTLLTKADAGQIKLNKEPVSLHELVQDAFEDTKILAAPHNISVTLEKCEPITIQGDRHRLRQLLLNLTDNAVKYNQPNGKITLALTCSEGRGELRIANTGAGIPVELLPKVFARFFRADQSHNNSVDGCGLGLSICQWIVNAHGGSIRIASEQNKITVVEASFPIVEK